MNVDSARHLSGDRLGVFANRGRAASPPPLIVHVIHHFMMGGMENGLVNLVNLLPAEHYRHAVVCIEDFNDFRLRISRPDVEVIAMHRSRIGAQRLRVELFQLLRRLRPALVHSRNLSGLDALLPARLAGVPRCVHSEHGWDVDNLNGQRWRPRVLRRMHAPLVDRYITVSKDLARFLVDQVGIRASRISQIYNGVDTERFAPQHFADQDFLPPAFRGDGCVRIGTVGRFQPVKDQATLLHAFAEMLDREPALRAKARLILAGDGPLDRDLKSLASSLRIDDLAWFPGAVSDVPQLMRALDVFVLPSLNEGISNTLLEAMASGVPVLAAAVGGNVELVDDGVVGRLFAKGDRGALTQQLIDYVQVPAVRRKHAEAARVRVVDRFGVGAMLKGYREVYDGLQAVR